MMPDMTPMNRPNNDSDPTLEPSSTPLTNVTPNRAIATQISLRAVSASLKKMRPRKMAHSANMPISTDESARCRCRMATL